MALNKNHEFEDLNGIKCGIVEKNVSPERLTFLQGLLEYNGYTVVAIPSPAPKAAAAPKEGEPVTETPPPPSTFTVGVTDYTFNTINALYGRLLKTRTGHIVTPAFWQQLEAESQDEVPYYESR